MRRSTPDAKRANITNALKDLDIVDLDQRIRLDEKNTQLFTTQLQKDSKFLADCGIIDYSLLLGVHHIEGPLPPRQPEPCGRYVPFWQKDYGGVLSEDKTEIYYMGVIDILIRWERVEGVTISFNARKLGELAIKSVFQDAKGVSVQFPSLEWLWRMSGRCVPEALHALHAAAVGAWTQGDQAGSRHPEEVPKAARREEEAGGRGEGLPVAESEHDGETQRKLKESVLICLFSTESVSGQCFHYAPYSHRDRIVC